MFRGSRYDVEAFVTALARCGLFALHVRQPSALYNSVTTIMSFISLELQVIVSQYEAASSGSERAHTLSID